MQEVGWREYWPITEACGHTCWFPILQASLLFALSRVQQRHAENENKVCCNSNLCLSRCWVGVFSQWCRSISSFCHRRCRRSSLWHSPVWQKLLLMPRNTAPMPVPRALNSEHWQNWMKLPAHGKVQPRYAFLVSSGVRSICFVGKILTDWHSWQF